MTKEKTAKVSDVTGLINQLAPSDLAAQWDNVGLQIGDPGAKVERILVCLDVQQQIIETAVRLGAQLIVAHHPLIFRPLKRLSPADASGALIYRAIQQNIAVVAAHTNLDRAQDGLNDWLAARLGLTRIKPLERPEHDGYRKLVVYVPIGHEQQMMDALFAAGAGHIGAYDHCSFRTAGTGTFRGGEDSDPFIGTAGAFEEAQELRLETIFPVALQDKIIPRMIKAHPYEEVAYDLIPLANPRNDVGLGRIGELEQSVSLSEFSQVVKRALDLPFLRQIGSPTQKISRIAVCGGSGMSTFVDAARLGADCLVTGDVKYHEAQQALEAGIAVIDAGHFGTEKIMVEELAKRLRQLAAATSYKLDIITSTEEKDPFTIVT